MDELLRVDEVAAALSVSTRKVRDWVSDGTLPALYLGAGPKARIRIEREAVEDWLVASTARRRHEVGAA